MAALTGDELREELLPDADYAFPFHIVTKGQVLCRVEGHAPVLLRQHDIIAVPTGVPHFVMDRTERPIVRVAELQGQIEGHPPTLEHGGEGEANEILCGFFSMRGKLFNPLIDALPSLLVIRGTHDDAAWMTATFCKAYDQMVNRRPGSEAMVERLTETLFLDLVQSHLQAGDGRGWLAGLRDPMVSQALGLLHAEPAEAWTVEALARQVGASRSALATRFRETVGSTIIRYLTDWRMELAAASMLETNHSIAQIAADVGYESEASFNRAFRRHVGQPPASWRRDRLLVEAEKGARAG